jgi:hypothetical protein
MPHQVHVGVGLHARQQLPLKQKLSYAQDASTSWFVIRKELTRNRVMGQDVIRQHGRDFDAQLFHSLLCFARHTVQCRWDVSDAKQTLTTSLIKKSSWVAIFWVLIFS